MTFVDGENLSIRWKEFRGARKPPPYVKYVDDLYVWSPHLDMSGHRHCEIIRKHYYTSAQGDRDKLESIHDELQAMNIEAPFVFPKTKGRGSKRVDIQLSVDMLVHAYQGNYDAAVLVAGDADYIPLVTAVKNTGRRVYLWFVENGLNRSLRRAADHFCDIGPILTDADAARFL